MVESSRLDGLMGRRRSSGDINVENKNVVINTIRTGIEGSSMLSIVVLYLHLDYPFKMSRAHVLDFQRC